MELSVEHPNPQGATPLPHSRVTRLRRLLRASFATVAGILPIVLFHLGIANAVEHQLFQQWFSIRGDRKPPQSVVVVRVDKTAYERIKSSTGEESFRKQLAMALDSIAAAEPQMILLDFVLGGDEPSEADRVLADALARSPSVIGKAEAAEESELAVGGLQRTTPLEPSPLFAESAKAVDLQVRTVNGMVWDMSLANDRGNRRAEDVRLVGPLRNFTSQEIEPPRGGDLINYYGGHRAVPDVSLADVVLANTETQELIRNRVVFIGLSGLDPPRIGPEYDSFMTPASKQPMYGVEIHATIAANLLDGTWLRRLAPEWELLLMSWVALTLAFAMIDMRFVPAAAMVAFVSITLLAVSYYSFWRLHYLVPALTVCGVVAPTLLLLRWIVAIVERTRQGARAA